MDKARRMMNNAIICPYCKKCFNINKEIKRLNKMKNKKLNSAITHIGGRK